MYSTYIMSNISHAQHICTHTLTPESKCEPRVVVWIAGDHMETCWNAAKLNSTTDASTFNTVDDTAWLHQHKPTVDVASVAACEFLAGRCSSSGVGRPARMKRSRLDAAWPAEAKGWGEDDSSPAALGKIWAVDGWMWTEISRMASALHTHTHTHTYSIATHTHALLRY